MKLKKTVNLGKIDFHGAKKKINAVEIELAYNDGVFTASAEVWNAKHTDIIICGQCFDELEKFFPNSLLFNKIVRLWKLYHLNDMHSGTPGQEQAIKKYFEETGQAYNYEKACEYLKSIGLYSISAFFADRYRTTAENIYKPFLYGHEWLFWEIPEEDKAEIQKLLADEIV